MARRLINAVLLVAVCASFIYAEPAPLPDEAAAQQARERVRQVYSAEYTRTTPADRTKLAAELLRVAGETGDPAAKYVLLDEALRLSAEVADVELAENSLNQLAAAFAVDAVAQRHTAAGRLSAGARSPEAAERLATLILDWVAQAVQADDLDAAVSLLAPADGVAGPQS